MLHPQDPWEPRTAGAGGRREDPASEQSLCWVPTRKARQGRDHGSALAGLGCSSVAGFGTCSGPLLPSTKPWNDSSRGLRLCGVHGPEGGGMAPDGLVCISKVCSHRGPLLSLKLAGPQRGSLSYARKDF